MAVAVDEPFSVLERSPRSKDGDRSFIENDGVVLAGLAVGLHDDLVFHAGHGPRKCGSPVVEVDVLPSEAEVRSSAVAGGSDECPRNPQPMFICSCPVEERSCLFGGPHWANGLGLWLAWGRGVLCSVVVHQAELHRILQRATDDRVNVPNGSHSKAALALRSALRPAHDRGHCVLRQWLLVGELIGKFLGNGRVAVLLRTEVGDSGIDPRIVSSVRRSVVGDVFAL